ncbi:MAG TPA: Gfo/Idh/MocA family oxidoreductase [Victivallales bacterium]|nr:Gfo/Idh/MocA family oxidoreductase [Victivallales bacterium]
MKYPLNVLVVGCGRMGAAHAKAYQEISEYNIVGLVSRNPETREVVNKSLGADYPMFSDFDAALRETKPDVVSINTYSETHSEYAIKSFMSGAHVFLEKPIAPTLKECSDVINAARKYKRKLVVGYILHYHPSWKLFVDKAKSLGKPLVMRLNLNQQTEGANWTLHKKMLQSTSPIVDCGVHYVDLMCKMTEANPVKVSGIGSRLSYEISEDMYNYGQLQVTFDDGSVGWYEASWGPMISETAYFIKDVMGPKGSVSFLEKQAESGNINSHTDGGAIKIHSSEMDSENNFISKDENIELLEEPNHELLCRYEQEYLLKAIKEDIDLTTHMNDAYNSLKIVLAADESIRTGETVYL